jgi:hypothetical protein
LWRAPAAGTSGHHWQGLNTTRVLGFTKGRALVLVKLPFTGEHVYDVVVDYRGADRVV